MVQTSGVERPALNEFLLPPQMTTVREIAFFDVILEIQATGNTLEISCA
jgi:hypothetical protein